MWDALLSEGALAIVRVALTLFDKVRKVFRMGRVAVAVAVICLSFA